MVPKFRSPENLKLVVAGGTAGRFSAIVPGWTFSGLQPRLQGGSADDRVPRSHRFGGRAPQDGDAAREPRRQGDHAARHFQGAGNHLLDRIEELLRERATPKAIIRKKKPTFARPAPDALRREIVGATGTSSSRASPTEGRAQRAVCTTACSSRTSGIPVATVISAEFVRAARLRRTRWAPRITRHVVVPHPIQPLTREEVRALRRQGVRRDREADHGVIALTRCSSAPSRAPHASAPGAARDRGGPRPVLRVHAAFARVGATRGAPRRRHRDHRR